MSHLVMVIDDSPTVRKILEVCLGREGYQVQSFQDGVDLISWLLKPGASVPAVVIVDLNLPTIDGYTLIRHLKAKPTFAQTRFVILTGRDGVLDKFKGRLSGAHAYLTKPFRTDDILATVHACLGPDHVQHPAENKMAVAH